MAFRRCFDKIDFRAGYRIYNRTRCHDFFIEGHVEVSKLSDRKTNRKEKSDEIAVVKQISPDFLLCGTFLKIKNRFSLRNGCLMSYKIKRAQFYLISKHELTPILF